MKHLLHPCSNQNCTSYPFSSQHCQHCQFLCNVNFFLLCIFFRHSDPMDLTPLFTLPAATDASDGDTNVAGVVALSVSGMVLLSTAAYLKLKFLWARQQGDANTRVLWSKGSSTLSCTSTAASAAGQGQLLIDFDNDGGRFISRDVTPADNLSSTRDELQVFITYVVILPIANPT